MKANQEKEEPIDFYLYTTNSPCASDNPNPKHSSCLKNMFLATHQKGKEWSKKGHHLDVGFAQWYLYKQYDTAEKSEKNFCTLRQTFEERFSDKSKDISITFVKINQKEVSDPC